MGTDIVVQIMVKKAQIQAMGDVHWFERKAIHTWL
jgi:hypothetical protein